MDVEAQKRVAAERAANLVSNGMAVGLGSGTTAEVAVHILGRLYREGLRFRGVPTSSRTAEIAQSYGVPLTTLEQDPELDLAIDGADEVDHDLNCIKGHGGQLLREKIVAAAAREFVVLIDSGKRVQHLGDRSPIPVEVVPFGWTTTQARLQKQGYSCSLRGGATPYVTAGQNYILDCEAPPDVNLADEATGTLLKSQVGVVEHGIFLAMATIVVVGLANGSVQVLQRRSQS